MIATFVLKESVGVAYRKHQKARSFLKDMVLAMKNVTINLLKNAEATPKHMTTALATVIITLSTNLVSL